MRVPAADPGQYRTSQNGGKDDEDGMSDEEREEMQAKLRERRKKVDGVLTDMAESERVADAASRGAEERKKELEEVRGLGVTQLRTLPVGFGEELSEYKLAIAERMNAACLP